MQRFFIAAMVTVFLTSSSFGRGDIFHHLRQSDARLYDYDDRTFRRRTI